MSPLPSPHPSRQVAKVLVSTDPVSGALNKRLKVVSSMPTDFFCLVRSAGTQLVAHMLGC